VSEGLHRIGPRGVTTPFELDPFARRLAFLMTVSLERLTELVERWTAQMRKILAAVNEAQRSFAQLAPLLQELE
jgi:hypothetical protein